MPLNETPDASTTWLKNAVDATKDCAVVLLDPSGRIEAWRGAAENVLGYTAEEAIGQPFGMLFTPEDRDAGLDRQELEAARRNGRSEDDRWHLRKGGVRFWSNGVLQAIHDADGRLLGFSKILRDRSDIRTQVDALQHRVDALAADLERRREFMVRLGHELRNPLAPIRATVYTIRRLDDPRLQRACEVLDRQVEVMVRLLDDLAEATRADVRVARIQPQRVVLQDMVRTAAGAMQAGAEARRQHLAAVVPDVPITFEADPTRLQQMLVTLLGNAVASTPAGGHISITATLEGDMVTIRVEHDGTGMREGLVPEVPGLVARGARGEAFDEDPGAGLAAVEELAALHGGTFAVRSGERGSVFSLRLPLAQPRAAPSDPP